MLTKIINDELLTTDYVDFGVIDNKDRSEGVSNMNSAFWTAVYDRAAKRLRDSEIDPRYYCCIGAVHDVERWRKVMKYAAHRFFIARSAKR